MLDDDTSDTGERKSAISEFRISITADLCYIGTFPDFTMRIDEEITVVSPDYNFEICSDFDFSFQNKPPFSKQDK